MRTMCWNCKFFEMHTEQHEREHKGLCLVNGPAPEGHFPQMDGIKKHCGKFKAEKRFWFIPASIWPLDKFKKEHGYP